MTLAPSTADSMALMAVADGVGEVSRFSVEGGGLHARRHAKGGVAAPCLEQVVLGGIGQHIRPVDGECEAEDGHPSPLLPDGSR